MLFSFTVSERFTMTKPAGNIRGTVWIVSVVEAMKTPSSPASLCALLFSLSTCSGVHSMLGHRDGLDVGPQLSEGSSLGRKKKDKRIIRRQSKKKRAR